MTVNMGGIRYFCVVATSTFLIGSSFVAAKILINASVPPVLLGGWRFVLAAAATLPLAWLLEGRATKALIPREMGLSSWVVVVLIGLLQTAAVMGLGLTAMRWISAQTTAILLFTNPLWVALAGRFFLDESLNGWRGLGMLLGITGVALAIGGGQGHEAHERALYGDIFGLAAAMCWAAATVINKRFRLPIGPWALTFWQMSIGGIALLLVGYAIGYQWPDHLSRKEWGCFLWLALPASTGSFGLWFVALTGGGATRTSGYLFLAPLFTILLAHFVLGSPFTWSQGAGGVFIGLAIWFVNRGFSLRTDLEKRNKVLAGGYP